MLCEVQNMMKGEGGEEGGYLNLVEGASRGGRGGGYLNLV